MGYGSTTKNAIAAKVLPQTDILFVVDCLLLSVQNLSDVLWDFGVLEHVGVPGAVDDVFFAMTPIVTGGGDDHQVEGCAVVMRDEMFELIAACVELLEVVAAEAHIA